MAAVILSTLESSSFRLDATSDLDGITHTSAKVLTGGSSGIITPSAYYPWLKLFLQLTTGSNMTLSSTFLVWLLESVDGGTTFENGSSSLIPTKVPVIFTMRAGTTFFESRTVIAPTKPFKVLVQNNTGQTISSTPSPVNSLTGIMRTSQFN